jgi:hypothetical protein
LRARFLAVTCVEAGNGVSRDDEHLDLWSFAGYEREFCMAWMEAK